MTCQGAFFGEMLPLLRCVGALSAKLTVVWPNLSLNLCCFLFFF